eukprot:TRINITY_DN94262_c0_g1_i1.p1 TRINITY_DN94262_c0_g1~~TRINITY_DN94262_c0_g1_i1.p1  ORF type:complete len:608 (-),score=78.15 TRINITY_DN94262_c0_g1_i1:31-1779(-)
MRLKTVFVVIVISCSFIIWLLGRYDLTSLSLSLADLSAQGYSREEGSQLARSSSDQIQVPPVSHSTSTFQWSRNIIEREFQAQTSKIIKSANAAATTTMRLTTNVIAIHSTSQAAIHTNPESKKDTRSFSSRDAFRGSGDAACEKELGSGLVEKLQKNQQTLCKPRRTVKATGGSSGSISSSGSSSVLMYSNFPEPGTCSSRWHPEAQMVVAENTSLQWTSTEKGWQMEIAVDCEDAALSKVDRYVLGLYPGGRQPAQLRVKSGSSLAKESCVERFEKNTILVINPRREYFQNLWHMFEEVFALFTTIQVVQSSTTDFQYHFLWWNKSGSLRLMRMPHTKENQTGIDSSGFAPHNMKPNLLDAFQRIFVGESCGQSLGPHSYNDQPTLCYNRVVFPLRACNGSPLSRAMDFSNPCVRRGGLGLALEIVEHVKQVLSLQEASRQNSMSILLIERKSGAHGRKLQFPEQIAAAIESIKGRPLVRRLDLAMLPFEEQVKVIIVLDGLVGVHGAGLLHALWLPPSAVVVEITPALPANNFGMNNVYRSLCLWSGKRYGAVLGADHGEHIGVKPRQVAEALRELLPP